MSLTDDFMREIKDKVNNILDNVTDIKITQAVHSQRLDTVDKVVNKVESLQSQLIQLEKKVIEKTNETYRDLSQKIITLYFDGYTATSGAVKMHQRQQQKIFDEHVTTKYGEEHPSLALYKRLAGGAG